VSENIITYRSQIYQFALSLWSTCSISHRFVVLSYLAACFMHFFDQNDWMLCINHLCKYLFWRNNFTFYGGH
jgi:hypothetical protein